MQEQRTRGGNNINSLASRDETVKEVRASSDGTETDLIGWVCTEPSLEVLAWNSRVAMSDALALDALALRRKASGFRRLAADILGGDFRRRLLELALEYERRATQLDRRVGPHGLSAAGRRVSASD